MKASTAIVNGHSLTTVRRLGSGSTYQPRSYAPIVCQTCAQTRSSLYRSTLGILRTYGSKGQALIKLMNRADWSCPSHLNSVLGHQSMGLRLAIIKCRWQHQVKIVILIASLFYQQVDSKFGLLFLTIMITIRTITNTFSRRHFSLHGYSQCYRIGFYSLGTLYHSRNLHSLHL